MLKESIGNYFDCRLTLQPAEVSGCGICALASFDNVAYVQGISARKQPYEMGKERLVCLVPEMWGGRKRFGSQDPLCTPDGYIFSKEAILQNLLDQKKGNKRKFAAWKAQQDEEERKVRCFVQGCNVLNDTALRYCLWGASLVSSSMHRTYFLKCLKYSEMGNWQAEERRVVEEQSRIIAFDRQNHMGATDNIAKSITYAIQEEAEQLLADRTTICGAITIQENADRMKVVSCGSSQLFTGIRGLGLALMSCVILTRGMPTC